MLGFAMTRDFLFAFNLFATQATIITVISAVPLVVIF